MVLPPVALDARFFFDPVEHIYRIDRKIVSSVTGVMAENNLIDLRWFTEEARLRGTRVHIATHYLDEGDLDWNTILDRDKGYIKSWELYKIRANVEIVSVEAQVYDPFYGHAGTYDRILRINGKRALWMIDLKTVGDGKGRPPFWAKYQTAAYEGMYRVMHGGAMMRRGAIVLQADGSLPKLYEHYESTDYPDFLAMSQSTKIRRTHKREYTIPTE